MGEKCGKWSFLRHYAAKDVHERHLRKLNWTWTSAYTRKLKKHRKLCGTKTKLSRDISVIALYAGVWICNRGNSGMLESIPRLTFSSSHSVSLFPSWICWTLFIQKSSKVIKKACCCVDGRSTTTMNAKRRDSWWFLFPPCIEIESTKTCFKSSPLDWIVTDRLQ